MTSLQQLLERVKEAKRATRFHWYRSALGVFVALLNLLTRASHEGGKEKRL